MFAKISTLSLFVLCLFSLGQAAPVVDHMSLSTREVSSDLVIRGIFSNMLHKKLDAADQKRVDNVTINAHCRALISLLHTQKELKAAETDLTAEESKVTVKGNKSKDPEVQEYQKRIKEFTKWSTKVGDQAKHTESELKKLGVTDAEAHCKTASSSTSSSTSHSSSSTSHSSSSSSHSTSDSH